MGKGVSMWELDIQMLLTPTNSFHLEPDERVRFCRVGIYSQTGSLTFPLVLITF
jgi:hypothetical protein